MAIPPRSSAYTSIRSVGLWYETFDQTTDEEVVKVFMQALEDMRKAGAEIVLTKPVEPEELERVLAGDSGLDG